MDLSLKFNGVSETSEISESQSSLRWRLQISQVCFSQKDLLLRFQWCDVYLGDLWGEMGVGLLQTTDGTVAQSPNHGHKRVKVLQLEEFLSR